VEKVRQPDLVTMENVPPLADQPVFKEFLAWLEGYSVDYGVVDVRKVGLPQTRKRLVLVGSRLGPVSLASVDPGRSPATVREAICSLRPVAADEADPHDPLHVVCSLSPTNMARIRASRPGGTWRDWPEELRATCHLRATGATSPAVYGRMSRDEPRPTITTQCFGYGKGRFGRPEQDRAINFSEAATATMGSPTTRRTSPASSSVSSAAPATLSSC
jgi:DNA (cytosine-5)-methyltransferase 1